jgi:hypothetical protein
MHNLDNFLFNGAISITTAELRGKKWNSLLEQRNKGTKEIVLINYKGEL